jgi:hypothetical protein
MVADEEVEVEEDFGMVVWGKEEGNGRSQKFYCEEVNVCTLTVLHTKSRSKNEACSSEKPMVYYRTPQRISVLHLRRTFQFSILMTTVPAMRS